MRKIALAVNQTAGRGLSRKLANQLVSLLTAKQVYYTLFTDKWPASFEGFTDVWIIGGDGTLNYFINHYPDITIPLVLFKGGTGNDFAWKLYGHCSTKEQFELALSASPKPVDAASCNNSLFINGVGIGFDGEVLELMKTIRLIGGHIGYYLVVLKKILTFKESSFKIYTNGLLADEKFLLVMINNSSRTGGGFHVSPKATVNDGLLDLVIVKPLNILKRFFYLPMIEKGRHLQLPFVSHVTGTEFTVECERELPAQLDGELIRAQRFTISLLKSRFFFKY